MKQFNGIEITVKGTENVLKAALEHKVKRIVHVSTISVYGQTGDGDLDESTPRKYSKEVYADSKREAEKLAFHYFKKYGMPVSIIPQTVVYGPFAPVWTLGPLNQLKTGRVILVEDGSGLCNAVYVDDVIQAMILAAIKAEAVGQAFLISSEEPVTWRDFYGAYEKILGVKSTISMGLSERADLNRKYKRKSGTISQIMTALQRPEIQRGILQLSPINKLYHISEVLIPNPLWTRFKGAFKASSNGRQKLVSLSQHIIEQEILKMPRLFASWIDQ